MIFFNLEKQKAIIVSGYFNPIHKGHLEYFNNAKVMADKLYVIVINNFKRDKTIIMVTHRMTTLSNCSVRGKKQ